MVFFFSRKKSKSVSCGTSEADPWGVWSVPARKDIDDDDAMEKSGWSLELYILSLLGQELFDVVEGLFEDLLLELGVFDFLLDLRDDGGSEFLLFTLTHLALVSDPRVEDGLGLVGEVNLLLELEALGLELGGLLGKGEKGLGDADNVLDLVDVLNSVLDGLDVALTSLVQDVSEGVDVTLGPGAVGGAHGLGHDVNDGGEGTQHERLGVDDVHSVRDGVDGGGSACCEDAGLGKRGVAREGLDDGVCLGLGVLRLLGGVGPHGGHAHNWTTSGLARESCSAAGGETKTHVDW
jgi:hypothetical protein